MHRLAMTMLLACAGCLNSAWSAEPQAPTSTPAEACAALTTHKFLDIPDAVTRVNSAVIVPATATVPEHCKVDAVVAPQVGIELALPTSGWNGRLLMQGCGGTCGVLSTIGCQDMLARNFAVYMTDMGHRGGNVVGASWAQHNLQGLIDFGYRATHVSTVAAKVIQTVFYGKPPSYTYFRGCSTGGRQAMVEAQRFPDDFDGIIAIAPPLDETGDTPLHLGWSALAATEKSGRKIIDADDVKLVHAAVVAACNPNQAITDGVVQDPFSCGWKPADLACKPGSLKMVNGSPSGSPSGSPNASSCLSAEKVAAFQKIYDGARNSQGKKLFVGGMPLGSELGWFPYFVAPDAGLAKVLDPNWLVAEFMQYLLYYDRPGPAYDVFDFDYDRDPQRLGLMEQIYYAKNPDLRPYKARNGKLILVHGLADPLIPPALIADYYESVTRLMGGPDKTRDFFRLFMVPGMQHCVGGDTADSIDYMTYLQNWVEQGVAPDSVMAHHTITPQSMIAYTRFPITREQWDWARPIFPYPEVAAWNGKGHWQDPANWLRKPGQWMMNPGAAR
jgi:feruloyl esterase